MGSFSLQEDPMVQAFLNNKFITFPVTFLVLVLSFWVVPWLLDPHGLRKYPGPKLAAFSNLWLAYHARHGVRYKAVHAAHKKYGTFVRIAPNNLSIADPDAVPVIYGHGTGTLKTEFYDAFVSIRRGLFNTRDRAEHTRKRKMVSHTFSQRSVLEFEPYIQEVVRQFLRKWDEKIAKNATPDPKDKSKSYWFLDTLPWFNFLAFDIIGDLAFGSPFGMIEREEDLARVEDENGKILELPAVQILNDRGEYSATQGVLPLWIRPYTKYFDKFFDRGGTAVENLAGIARARVNARLKEGASDRKDLLARLQEARDDKGQLLGKDELTAEALTQLIAGSDTTSNSSCAISFWIAKHPEVHKKLVDELYEHFKPGEHDGVFEFEDVKDLPYLQAVINEGLRVHATGAMGLPRVIVKGTNFKDHYLVPGTICSVPTYTLQRLDSFWGDGDVYRPERWLENDPKELEKAFLPFSYGPRSCVGRNLANMELLVFVSTLFYRYDFTLPDMSLEEIPSAEGFLRKPTECQMGIRMRQHA